MPSAWETPKQARSSCGHKAMTNVAVSGLAKGLARDLGPLGIKIKSVMPGPTKTDMNPAVDPDAVAVFDRTAVKRSAQPDEVGDFVAYRTGRSASVFPGANLAIDDGYTA